MDFRVYWRQQKQYYYQQARKCERWASQTLPEYSQWWRDQAADYRQRARKYAAWEREAS
jgi:hypothetical protein